jgi:hypothetical protein
MIAAPMNSFVFMPTLSLLVYETGMGPAVFHWWGFPHHDQTGPKRPRLPGHVPPGTPRAESGYWRR